MVTTDVGIAGVLPYIQALVHATRRREAMVRKLEVVWQIDDYRERPLGDSRRTLTELD